MLHVTILIFYILFCSSKTCWNLQRGKDYVMMREFVGIWKEQTVQPAATPLPLGLYQPWWLIEHTLKYCKTTEYFRHWPPTANQIAPANNSITFGNLTLNKIWGTKLDPFHTRLRQFPILVLESDIPWYLHIIKGVKTFETTLLIVFIVHMFRP